MSESAYRPGVCNIGRAERRRRYGLAGCCFAVAAGYLAAVVSLASLPTVLLVGLFVPLSLAVEWSLQGRRSFCATLALAGRYDFSGDGGERGRVSIERDRLTDRRYAFQLTLLGLLGGSVLTALVYAVVAVV